MITGQTVKNTYQGDGVNREFTITFEFTDASQVKFKVNGQEVETNYSLNPVSKILTYPTVASELDPLTSADEIEIYRDTTITQDIEFNNGGPLNADMIEDGLDKLTMIAQEVKALVLGDTEGEVKVLADGTNIDDIVEEGLYFIQSPTSTLGLPPFILNSQIANQEPYSSAVLLDVKRIDRENDHFNGYKTGYFLGIGAGSGSGQPYTIAVRAMGTYPSSWRETGRIWRSIETRIGVPDNTIYVPSYFYGKTSYFIPYKELSADDTLTSLTLNHIEDTPLPIEIYFRTGDSFSGITASDIIAWIGSTTLDTNSAYKITITNLVAKIEKLTLAE